MRDIGIREMATVIFIIKIQEGSYQETSNFEVAMHSLGTQPAFLLS